MKPIAFEVPIKTVPGMNVREHWAVRKKRVDAEKRAVGYRFPRVEIAPVLVVRLTRLSAGELDDDNLRGSLKSIRDAVATKLRVDDATRLVRWEYAQQRCERGEYAVRVEISEVAREGA